jgi:hypothetical protein
LRKIFKKFIPVKTPPKKAKYGIKFIMYSRKNTIKNNKGVNMKNIVPGFIEIPFTTLPNAEENGSDTQTPFP